MSREVFLFALTAALLTAAAQPQAGPDPEQEPVASPAAAVAEPLASPARELVEEVLARNPEVARATAAATAAEQRAPQVKALPDPMAAVTAFLMTPETRVGPVQLAAMVSQGFPWFGKLALREQQALYQAAAARAGVEAKRLMLVTETLRLWYELAFLAAQEEVVMADRATLEHYEQLARARYASGVGLQQEVVKIQAEITKDDNRLLEIGNRRAELAAALNALRDRPADTVLPAAALPVALREPELVPASVRLLAHQVRPEVGGARALIAAAASGVELAEKEYKPDFSLGLGYTVVGRRDDAAGRAMPPEGNGDDDLSLTFGFNIPVQRRKLAAGVSEAAAMLTAAEEELRSVSADIDRQLGELLERVPLARRQLALFEDLLILQAEEALRSAESAYAAGAVNALDLLDAERVLLDVRISAARSRADYLIAIARLEGAVGAPLGELAKEDA